MFPMILCVSWTCKLIERDPPPRGGFLFTMFPDQEPGGRGHPSKHLVQILRGVSSPPLFPEEEDPSRRIYIYAYIYICICIQGTYIYTYIRIYIYAYIYVYVYMYTGHLFDFAQIDPRVPVVNCLCCACSDILSARKTIERAVQRRRVGRVRIDGAAIGRGSGRHNQVRAGFSIRNRGS